MAHRQHDLAPNAERPVTREPPAPLRTSGAPDISATPRLSGAWLPRRSTMMSIGR